MASHSPPERRAPVRVPFFYGWVIVGVCVVSTVFAGATSQLFASIMVLPITEEMGWSRTQVAGALTIGVVVTAFLGPLLGPLADRYGPRGLMAVGAVIASAGFFGLANLRHLWHFYGSYVVARGVSQAALSGVVTGTAVANWFVRRRGRAMGLTGSAFNLSNTLLIPLAQLLIQRSGWRTVYTLLGLGSLVLVMFPAALLLRRRPEDVGLLPDGAASAGPQAAGGGGRAVQGPPEVQFTAGEAVRSRAFWLLVAAQFVTVFINGSLTFNMAPHFAAVGIAPAAVAAAVSLFALTSGLSSALWGLLAERFSERILGIVSTLLGAGLVVSLVEGRADLLAVLASGLYGLAARGEGSVLQLIVARYFGRRSYGAITGTLGTLGSVGLGLGPLLGSLAFDRFATYTGFLRGLVLCHLLVAVLLVLALPPRPPARSHS